ncbi:hypothetical protein GYMLUDRAFT_47465 [Collybiopsis luxurians FD-317 M1]|uniref:FAS1 domain-containing protein n=1 Tax=Collybiopsis luxurians FD-317 M1 TaxID=944289 RepID=A0A0D0CLK8_9AGAR|nr:hypothetical protein GYMLUDRAFT_47465 [Collybiopsis luxurians FD-317 M1]
MRLTLFSLSLILVSSPFVTATADPLQIPITNPSSSPEYDMSESAPWKTNGLPTLADLLTIESSASIFYSYARELSLSELFSTPPAEQAAHFLDDVTGKGGLMLLVPTNKAVMALARKPHQSPPSNNGQEIEVSEQEYDRQSKENVQRWVEAHIIPTSPLDFPSDSDPTKTTTYDTLLEGKSVSFVLETNEVEVRDGESRIRILSSKTASNGMLYLIDGTINVD